ncbi:MAG: hypothetical protein HRT41_04395 [Campylobacteraceae bacterium]|nr:hypothetical protein [Campylobacteraceae bacterium]
MKKIKNILYLLLLIILSLNFLFFGIDSFIGLIFSSFMILILLPLFIFMQSFPRVVSLKKELPLGLVYETIFKKKMKVNTNLLYLIIIVFLVIDYLSNGLKGIFESLLTYWFAAATLWLILLLSYSYHLYINED